MNTTLTNIAEVTSHNESQLIGYQELKLISFFHDTECYQIVGPIPISREGERTLLLWIPSLDREARQTSDFTRLWIKEPFMIRFAAELWRQFKKKGTALVQADAELALEKATKPMEHVA
jgi:hypothetical protein